MLVLAIDTSSAAVTAALSVIDGDDGAVEPLVERVTVNARGHGELLAPSIAQCLAEAGAQPSELAAIVAGTGPGPFTGLRVGLVTAAVLGDTLGIATYGVCSLDGIAIAVADNAASTRGAGPLLVATDARRKEVYWAQYLDGVRTHGPAVSRPADVRAGARAMTGAGARLYADVLGVPLLERDHPSGFGLVRLAADRIRAGAPSEPLTPLYLRRPDAQPSPTSKAVTP